MTQFVVGQPLQTTEPVVIVDGLKAGSYRFQLEVLDAAGNRSRPAQLIVTVRDAVVRRPTPA